METGSLTPEVKYQIEIPKRHGVEWRNRPPDWVTVRICVDDTWFTFTYFYNTNKMPPLANGNRWYNKCVDIIEQHWSEIESLVKEARLKASL